MNGANRASLRSRECQKHIVAEWTLSAKMEAKGNIAPGTDAKIGLILDVHANNHVRWNHWPVKNQNRTIRKIVGVINNPDEDGGFWLPNIQRPFVWGEDQICRRSTPSCANIQSARFWYGKRPARSVVGASLTIGGICCSAERTPMSRESDRKKNLGL